MKVSGNLARGTVVSDEKGRVIREIPFNYPSQEAALLKAIELSIVFCSSYNYFLISIKVSLRTTVLISESGLSESTPQTLLTVNVFYDETRDFDETVDYYQWLEVYSN